MLWMEAILKEKDLPISQQILWMEVILKENEDLCNDFLLCTYELPLKYLNASDDFEGSESNTIKTVEGSIRVHRNCCFVNSSKMSWRCIAKLRKRLERKITKIG